MIPGCCRWAQGNNKLLLRDRRVRAQGDVTTETGQNDEVTNQGRQAALGDGKAVRKWILP